MFVLLLISITFVSCADRFERSINRHFNKFILVDDLDEYEITVLFIYWKRLQKFLQILIPLGIYNLIENQTGNLRIKNIS